MEYGIPVVGWAVTQVAVACTLVVSIGRSAVCTGGADAIGGWTVPNIMQDVEQARGWEETIHGSMMATAVDCRVASCGR